MALTHSKILAAKPKATPYKLADTDRLYVLVSAAGKKYFKLNYRLGGKDRTYTFGRFPEVSLAEVRERRIALEKLIKQGIDPAEHEKQLQYNLLLEKSISFGAVAEEWISKYQQKWSPYYAKQVETYMRRYVVNAEIGKRPIRDVTTQEIYKLLSGVAKRTGATGMERKATGAPTLAILLRQWCIGVFRLAVLSGRADRNPVVDLKASDVIVRPMVKNNRALNPNELIALMKKLSTFTGLRLTGIAIELLMHTFVRTIELRAATWSELDLDHALWTIPAERMKVKNVGDHVVPLSKQTIALLKELAELTNAASSGVKWLFPNNRDPTRYMTATTINRALQRMGLNGKGTIGFSGHGFRGTASTLLHERGHRSEAIEAQLAHQERNAVKAAYNKAKYLKERSEMMQGWSDYLGELRMKSNSGG